MAKEINWKRNLFFIWLSQFTGLTGFACSVPFIPLLMRDNLGITVDAERGFYISAYYFCGMISFTVGTFIWGMLSDRFGYKIMLLRAYYGAAFFYPLMAFAPTVGVLLMIRFVTSFFSGTYNASQTLLVATVPPEKQGFALGTLSTALWSGNMTGFLVGGLVVHYFNYAAAFITCGALYVLGALMVQFFVVENFSREKVEKKTQTRFTFKQMLVPDFLLLLLLFLLMGVARRIDEPFLAMLVEKVHGKLDEAAFFTGVVSFGAALGGFISGVVIGKLCDRLSPQKILLPLLLLSGITVIVQACSVNVWMLFATRFLSYFAAGGVMPVLQVILARNTDPQFRGTFFGISYSINTAGGVLCAFISGAIAYYLNVRNILVAAGCVFLLMIPLAVATLRKLCKNNGQIGV